VLATFPKKCPRLLRRSISRSRLFCMKKDQKRQSHSVDHSFLCSLDILLFKRAILRSDTEKKCVTHIHWVINIAMRSLASKLQIRDLCSAHLISEGQNLCWGWEVQTMTFINHSSVRDEKNYCHWLKVLHDYVLNIN